MRLLLPLLALMFSLLAPDEPRADEMPDTGADVVTVDTAADDYGHAAASEAYAYLGTCDVETGEGRDARFDAKEAEVDRVRAGRGVALRLHRYDDTVGEYARAALDTAWPDAGGGSPSAAYCIRSADAAEPASQRRVSRPGRASDPC